MSFIKYIIGKILYDAIAKHLPVSYSYVKLGQRSFRAFCCRLIVETAGKNINIEQGAVFSRQTSIGDNSGIGINCIINGACTIGNDVMMGPECTIYAQNHRFSDTDIPMNKQGFSEEQRVVIGDDVWIGGHVIILPGVHISSHAIIGAGAVVTKDVPEWAVVAGNPARVVKMRK